MMSPQLYEGRVDEACLHQLVDDWVACAQILEVRCKRMAAGYADAPTDLADAVAALCRGQCRAVQVRYAWDGAVWCDTILAVPDGDFRLVRVEAGG